MHNLFSSIGDYKLITILRGFSLEETVNTGIALKDGGIHFIEVTFDQTKSDLDTCRAISALRKELPSIHIGAGTVITSRQLELAHNAGAEFIISPNTDTNIIKRTKELGMLSMPGAMTPSEIITACQAGADIVKVFPSDSLGLKYIKALRAPINHIPLAAVGGVSLNNIQDFFKLGIYCVGIGSNIADADAIHAGQYDVIRNLARSYAEKIHTL